MTESAMSEEADALYRPLGDLDPWAAVEVDEELWAEAVARLNALGDAGDMVRRGARLAAAHQSAALDGVGAPDREVALALLRGEASPASLDETGRAHVRANHDALLLARDTAVSEAAIRRIHEAACGPQLTHRVRVDGRIQDHVLAAGDYKHHPNHVVLPNGEWRPTAPVARVRPEMARLVEMAGGPGFTRLHPIARAAWLHHALDHVQPFADGNGRVARALAGGYVLRVAPVPPVFLAGEAAASAPAELVASVQRTFLATVDLCEQAGADPDPAAFDQWRRRSGVADRLRGDLEAALRGALDRYQGRRADLSGAEVSREPLVVGVALPDGQVVDDVLIVDAHPLDGGPVVVTAREARLRLEAGAPLDPWLDRVVSCLALRVAAELEEESPR